MIGVAGAGFRLSLPLNAVGCQLCRLQVEIHSISKGVSLFALMLKQVGQTDSVHSREAVDMALEIADQSQIGFAKMEDMLDKVRN